MAVVDPTEARPIAPGEGRSWLERIPAAYWIVGVLLLIMPATASDFILFQIFGWSFILGLIALMPLLVLRGRTMETEVVSKMAAA